MSLTNPYVGLTPRKMSKEEVVRAIRQDIIAELDAINLYQAHIDAIDDERVKKVLIHVRDDEKDHVGDFLALLKLLDPEQVKFLEEGAKDVSEVLEK